VEHVVQMDDFYAYSGIFSDDLVDRIRNNEQVEFVERDQIMSINKRYIFHPKKKAETPVADTISLQPSEDSSQLNAPWGISRLSSRSLPSSYGSYYYPENAGAGVDVYVIDTGINVEHNDFEGRAIWGKTIPRFDRDIDGNGHGSHCAGTIAGKTFGIAKKANLIAVKVLRTNGFGTKRRCH